MMLYFDWDENKNESNRKKHGIWFEEAAQVFDDPQAIIFFDYEHSVKEDRHIILGFSSSMRILIVIYCEKQNGKKIRIISARKATKNEVKRYEKGV